MQTGTKVVVGVAVVGGLAAGGILLLRHLNRSREPSRCGLVADIVGDIAGTLAGPSPEGAAKGDVAQRAAEAACNLLGNLPSIREAGETVINAGFSISDGLRNLLGISGPGTCDDAKRAENIRLNGAVVKRVHDRFPTPPLVAASICAANMKGPDGEALHPLRRDVPLEYANGCVPYSGHPGNAKCVQGTHALNRGQNAATRAMGTGRLGVDPTTREHTGAADKFPIPIPAGHRAFWVRGQPQTCAAGSTVATDHRASSTAHTSVCWPSGEADIPRTPRREGAGSPGTGTTTSGGRTSAVGTTRDHR